MTRKLLAILLALFSVNMAYAQSNKIEVDAATVLNKIPSTLYGSCIEDVNHEIYGGLYGQLLMGESFEEPASGVNYTYWKKSGGYWAADYEYSNPGISIVPGRRTRRMVARNDLDVEPDGSARLIYDAREINNGSIDVDMLLLQERGRGASVYVRTSKVGIGENSLNGYEIRLNRESGKLQLLKHRWNEELLAEKSVRFSGDGWNHLSIVFKGNVIYVALNAEKQVINFMDTNLPLTTGKVALGTAGSPVRFRNVTVAADGSRETLSLTYPADQKVSDRWDALQSKTVNAKFTLEQDGAYNGKAAQSVEIISGTGRAGVSNRGLNRWGVSVVKNEVLTGTCHFQTPDGTLPVTLALESADGKTVYARQEILVNGANWNSYKFSLKSIGTDTNARFSIFFERKGKLNIDQVTLFQSGERSYKGLPLRADIGNAIVSEGLTFLRYAGTMVNAHGYRFKKMIGERSLRPPFTGHWNEYSSNGFGIEDFIQFCEAAKITSAFAINIEETADDAADMVEYLNGDETTAWGKKRAQNGHPKPYAVKYIEIGNEEIFFEGDNERLTDHYIERFLALYDAIHRKDPSINVVCSAWWRPDSKNTEKVFKALDGKAAYWDYHVGGDDPKSGLEVDKQLTRMKQLFQTWNPDTKMKCAIFEENGGLHNMSRALGHATNLNAVRRHGDFLLTSCPANALQPYLQNDNGWDQGQIFFTPKQVWGMPPCHVQQLASKNHLPLRVKDKVEGNLDVTSTRSEDGKTLILHVVNIDTTEKLTELSLNNFAGLKNEAEVWTISGALKDENTPENPAAVSAKSASASINGNKMSYRFPANSYTVIKFSKR